MKKFIDWYKRVFMIDDGDYVGFTLTTLMLVLFIVLIVLLGIMIYGVCTGQIEEGGCCHIHFILYGWR